MRRIWSKSSQPRESLPRAPGVVWAESAVPASAARNRVLCTASRLASAAYPATSSSADDAGAAVVPTARERKAAVAKGAKQCAAGKTEAMAAELRDAKKQLALLSKDGVPPNPVRVLRRLVSEEDA